MYLSRLMLNNNRQCVLWRQQLYRVHQRLCMGGGNDGRLLFRLQEGFQPFVLVQTQQLPDWSSAFDDFEVLASLPEIKQFEPQFVRGQRLAFRLLANPTVKRKAPSSAEGTESGRPKGRRQGLYRADEQLAWLQRKAACGGFAVEGVTLQPKGKVTVRKRGKSPMRFCAVQFDGALQVLDPAVFEQTLAGGIGSGKGFGFGLLSVAPLRQ